MAAKDKAFKKALFINSPEDLKFWNEDYGLLYFGNEFCQRLIPSVGELERVIDFASAKGITISMVTCAVNDEGLRQIDTLSGILSASLPGSEMIFNDWGVLALSQRYNLKSVLGRLLTKQKRDPRISGLSKKLNPGARNRFKESGLNPDFIRFLKMNRIARVELDYLLQGMDEDFDAAADLKFSLYIPYGYIATARDCIFAIGNNQPRDCNKACQGHSFFLRHKSFDAEVIMKGKTLFFRNSSFIPEALGNERLDRIVYQPHIP